MNHCIGSFSSILFSCSIHAAVSNSTPWTPGRAITNCQSHSDVLESRIEGELWLPPSCACMILRFEAQSFRHAPSIYSSMYCKSDHSGSPEDLLLGIIEVLPGTIEDQPLSPPENSKPIDLLFGSFWPCVLSLVHHIKPMECAAWGTAFPLVQRRHPSRRVPRDRLIASTTSTAPDLRIVHIQPSDTCDTHKSC